VGGALNAATHTQRSCECQLASPCTSGEIATPTSWVSDGSSFRRQDE